jgi:6-phosphogluconolactonase
MRGFSSVLFAVLASLTVTGVAGAQSPGAPPARPQNVVFTETNEAGGNRLAVMRRDRSGQLAAPVFVGTGGTGTGAGLGNQGALALSGDGRFLYAVNAGSSSISVFHTVAPRPRLVQVLPSGGAVPVSIAVSGPLVYVLNRAGPDPAASPDNITGFVARPSGRLAPLSNSTRGLSANSTNPAQVGFNNGGLVLVVTEKATNIIDTFVVGPDGRPGNAIVHPSVGMTPFGFEFGSLGELVVSEAFGGAPDASACSSYLVGGDGSLAVITPSAPTTETAACWIAHTQNGQFVYTTNTGSDSVTGYMVGAGGALSTLTPDGRTGVTGAGPIDADNVGNTLLFTLNGMAVSVTTFRIETNGSLVATGTRAGIPTSASGLIAR